MIQEIGVGLFDVENNEEEKKEDNESGLND